MCVLTCLLWLSGSTPSRTAGFLGTSSPGPMAELYAAANQDSGVSSYISAASPAPSTGFGHSLGVGHHHPHTDLSTCMDAGITQSWQKLNNVHPQGPLIATAFTNGYHWEDSGHWWLEGFSSAVEPIRILAAHWWRNLIGWPQDSLGFPGSLRLHPPTEYLFLKLLKNCFAVLISLQHNVPVSPFFVLM